MPKMSGNAVSGTNSSLNNGNYRDPAKSSSTLGKVQQHVIPQKLWLVAAGLTIYNKFRRRIPDLRPKTKKIVSSVQMQLRGVWTATTSATGSASVNNSVGSRDSVCENQDFDQPTSSHLSITNISLANGDK